MNEQDIINEETRRRFQEILEYKGQILKEELVRADLGTLENAMLEDERTGAKINLKDGTKITLRQFLNLRAPELIKNFPLYAYLAEDIDIQNEKTTLLDVIKYTFLLGNKYRFFFSKSGSKITGFVAYVLNDTEVTDIKMFSFDPARGGGAGLVIDLRNLLKELIKDPNITRIAWFAMKDNPFNEAYKIAIGMYNGKVKEGGNVINYWIDKTQNNNF
jgi:hypothetical protein